MKHALFVITLLMIISSCGTNSENEAMEEFSENEIDSEAVAQEINIVLNKTQNLPEACAYTGQIIDIHSWSDLNGVNYFVRTLGEISEQPAKDEFDFVTTTQYLYAYHYVESAEGEIRLLKETTDFVKDCEFDLIIGHEIDAISLTDLDDNNVGEITFIYRTHCTSDVSPSTQKLIMLQDGNKYPLRGTTRVFEYGGEYTVGEEFNTAPANFLEHAKTLWSEYLTEYE